MIKLDLQYFGGRGASGGGGGAGAKGELVLPNGSKIEFTGTLHYDGDDKALTGASRQTIVSWEDKRRGAKIEYAYATDANGNPIGKEVRGGKGSVSMPYTFHMAETSTHIHPRGDGMLGGTFSTADLTNFANFGNTTKRAAAKEGTYSITKGKNFDASGFKQYVTKQNSDCRSRYVANANALTKKVQAGKMSYSDYQLASAKAFNTYLVECHNAYRNGQKTYGYTYTLEKTN